MNNSFKISGVITYHVIIRVLSWFIGLFFRSSSGWSSSSISTTSSWSSSGGKGFWVGEVLFDLSKDVSVS